MSTLLAFWTGMTIQRRIIVAAATVGMFALILTMARIASTPNMALLYAGLDSTTAGEVISALEANSSPYEVRGSNIFVESQARDQLRMTLASQGLPSSGTSGYEILEQMTGFGTTSQMFDAAYWRAKEGELARTIASSDGVQSARVHISNAGSTPFQRNTTITSSVTLQAAQGALGAQQARAIQFLVASAVTGLDPSLVTVIDAATGRIISVDADSVSLSDQEGRGAALQKRVERLMSARVGQGSYVVEVSVETVREQETLLQRTVDPTSRVVISTDTEETTNQSNNSGAGGTVTVASNLPEGDAAGGNTSSSTQNESTRERVNYDVSATEREVRRTPGAIKRLTVAVMVDGTRTTTAQGEEIWSPRSPEELDTLRELVQSAVGYDAERGDTVTLRSLEFDPSTRPEDVGELAGNSSLLEGLDIQSLLQFAVLGIIALLLGLFVVRPALRANLNDAPATAALPSPGAGGAGAKAGQANPAIGAEQGGAKALTGTIEDSDTPFTLPALGSVGDFDLGDTDGGGFDLPDLPAFSMAGSDATDEDVDPVERLRKLIEDRREETVEILRGWMEEKEEKA